MPKKRKTKNKVKKKSKKIVKKPEKIIAKKEKNFRGTEEKVVIKKVKKQATEKKIYMLFIQNMV